MTMRIIIILVIIIISYYYNFHKSNNNNHINKTNNNDPSYELWDPLSSESLYSDAIFPIYFISTHLNSFYQFFSLSVSWITNSYVSKSGDRSVVQSVRHSSVLSLRQLVGPAISYEIRCSLENITGIETSFLNKKCWELTKGCKDKKNRLQQRSEVI